MIPLIDQYSKEELEQIVNNSKSLKEVAIKLGYYSYSGGSAKVIRKRLDSFNISTNHFTRGREGIKRSPENVFIKGKCEQATLRKFYLEGNYTEYKCSICGQEPFWNGKELKMILDHISGNREDNTIENLRWVCPNCNIQLDTFGSKNRKKLEKKEIKNYCIDCGIEIHKDSTRCSLCSNENQRIIKNRISKEDLKIKIRLETFEKIGRDFGVSGNAIKKWCKQYNLPYQKYKINEYSDSEWELI